MSSAPDPVFITGPTGSGKSAVALALAAMTGGEIVCADAYQIYRGMEILTAQPSPEDLRAAPHHLYGFLDPSEEMDAGRFETLARETIDEIRSRGRLAIVCGGSGLYVKSLTHGLSPLPPGDPELRKTLEALSPEELAEKLTELDPVSAEQLNLKNPRHVIRAIEICLLTGRPASELKQSWAAPRPGVRGVCLEPDRQDLYDRINARARRMVEAGVLDEVRRLEDVELSATAEKAIGLWELRAALDEVTTLDEAVASLRQNTRNYAKRQITWFRREECFIRLPLSPLDTPEEIAGRIRKLFKLKKAAA